MKASEFYEKYWLVNGQKPPPLSEKEKQFLDECTESGNLNITTWFIRKRKRPITLNIDILKEEMSKLPPLMISDKNDDECDATDVEQVGEAG